MAKIKGYNELKKAIKNHSRYEWELAINTNNQRGKVYTQEELLKMFPAEEGDAHGASKTCYVLEKIVIKRQKTNCYKGFYKSNQVANEINTFINATEELKNVLCPILSYFKVKSDKVNDEDNKAYSKYIMISQKAIIIDDFKNCCYKAFKLNQQNNFRNIYINAEEMYRELERVLNKNGIDDWYGHDGNSGVIFDYENGYYKPVLIDYGL